MDWADFCAANIPEPYAITGEALTGTGGYGPTFAAPVTVSPCVIEHVRRRVPVQTADAAGGIVISPITVYCPSGTALPVGSRVTLPAALGGHTTRVLSESRLDSHGHDIPSHVELALE